MFGPLCDSPGVQVTLTYHCCGPSYRDRLDFCNPSGDAVKISMMLKERTSMCYILSKNNVLHVDYGQPFLQWCILTYTKLTSQMQDIVEACPHSQSQYDFILSQNQTYRTGNSNRNTQFTSRSCGARSGPNKPHT